MISQTSSSAISNAYQSQTKLNDTKATKQNSDTAKTSDTSRVDQLKEAISSGEYKVDLDALSEKIAESLL